MKRARLVAALTAALTALLLQATLVAPLAQLVPVSLPAVLVASIALVDGAGTGLAFGFALGLLADLGSPHPAGVLALCWMGVGLGCGTVAAWHSIPRGALVTACACGVATLVGDVILVAVGSSGATMLGAIEGVGPAAVIDGALALLLIPLLRAFLRTDSLRAPAPVFTDLSRTLAAHGALGTGSAHD
jgi:cell shape-determining protein MreD